MSNEVIRCGPKFNYAPGIVLRSTEIRETGAAVQELCDLGVLSNAIVGGRRRDAGTDVPPPPRPINSAAAALSRNRIAKPFIPPRRPPALRCTGPRQHLGFVNPRVEAAGEVPPRAVIAPMAAAGPGKAAAHIVNPGATRDQLRKIARAAVATFELHARKASQRRRHGVSGRRETRRRRAISRPTCATHGRSGLRRGTPRTAPCARSPCRMASARS